MDKLTLLNLADSWLATAAENRIQADDAAIPTAAGELIFTSPLLKVAAADDPCFEQLRDSPTAGCAELSLPQQWLDGAKSVICLFLPFSPAWRQANREHELCGPEGLPALLGLEQTLIAALSAAGARALAPERDPRFCCHISAAQPGDNSFGSNFSLRHAAWIAGLGTFSLNYGLITERGMAGRLSALVSDAELPPDSRPYTRRDEYCNHCGLCQQHCPQAAITAAGKQHLPCSRLLDSLRPSYHGAYNCSRCQLQLPCEHSRP